jgi:5-hydroxyisourate hydrolase
MSISVHVLDCMNGCAAADMAIRLCRDLGDAWQDQARGRTDAAGRLVIRPVARGIYQVECDLDGYFAGLGVTPFYPRISIVFRVSDVAAAFAISLLITPHGYGTYRGWQPEDAAGADSEPL